MQKRLARQASWKELLASPEPLSHIVQIYDAEDFLVSGVTVFAAEGLRRGEAVVLTGTQAHLRAITGKLSAQGVDVDSATQNGALRLFDVRAAVDAVLLDGMPEAARFQAAVAPVVAHAGRRFSALRWWAEMSNLLHQQGNAAGALAIEDLGDALAKKQGAVVFCSFLCDRFDPAGYDGLLKDLCSKHTHFIPAEDYVRHRLAVNRAIAEVVGEIKGPLLQSFLSWKGVACELPSSQAILFWIREVLPEQFREVLSRAKAYQLQGSAES